MNFYLDVFSLDCMSDNTVANLACIDRLEREAGLRTGPCEDDAEVVAPYVGMLPEESNHEHGSPLNFSSPAAPAKESQGFVWSVHGSILDRDFAKL